MSGLVSELRDLHTQLQGFLESAEVKKIQAPLARLEESANTIARAWSGSWLGYHSRVYYKGLSPPPPGAHFSPEWGFIETFSLGTRGDWQEYDFEEVRRAIEKNAGQAKLAQVEDIAKAGRKLVEDSREHTLSILETCLSRGQDPFLERLRDEVQEAKVIAATDYVAYLRPKGQLMSRDSLAATQGFLCPPHVAVLAEVAAIRSPIATCEKLDKIALRAASHLERGERESRRADRVGTNVFIGHGTSAVWKDLKDFVQDRLRLPWDEFNRVPVAGITNIARLAEMLDSAAVAFLVMTAEDELADGKVQARMNVIHEAGLFQGRLGFTRAIILLEEGCEEFGNIQGLGQIRFPKGNIKAVFEEIRRVLEREGLIEA